MIDVSTCTDWTAIHDFMPPRPPRLRVTGKCTFPTAGFKVVLKVKQPQGINPRILMLEKEVIPPAGPAADVVTTIDVRFEEKTDANYTDVQILPDGVTIKVQNVS